MSIYINNKYRFKRNSEHEEMMKYLIHELNVFEDYNQILMLSAMIGYNNDLYVPIKTAASDRVQISFFTERDYDIIDFIAYSREKQQNVLKDIRKYEIFENYANGGFPVLVDKLEIDFYDKRKNDRLAILKKLFSLILLNGFKM